MADKMQVILTEDVANLGESGELVAVKPGYGRNYLIPQGLAILATAKNVARIQHEKQIIEMKQAKTRAANAAAAGKLNGVSVTIERQAGEGDKLFGSVTAKDIAEALAAKGHKVDKKQILLAEPIKAVGEQVVDVKLGRDVAAKITVVVAAKA